MSLDELLERAAFGRRIAILIGHDPTAPRLEQYADELDAEIIRRSELA